MLSHRRRYCCIMIIVFGLAPKPIMANRYPTDNKLGTEPYKHGQHQPKTIPQWQLNDPPEPTKMGTDPVLAGARGALDKTQMAVHIGYFGPEGEHHPLGAMAWRGLVMALEELSGSLAGSPTSTTQAPSTAPHPPIKGQVSAIWSEQPWGQGISDLTRFVYNHSPGVLLGALGGEATHLLEQVATKARIAMVDPFSTDASVNEAHIPWVVSLLPPDRLYAQALTEELQRHLDADIVVITTPDHDSRQFFLALDKVWKSRGRIFHHVYQVKTQGSSKDLAEVLKGDFKAVVVVADVQMGAHWLNILMGRQAIMDIFTGPQFAQHVVLQSVTKAPQGHRRNSRVFIPLVELLGAELKTWSAQFVQRFTVKPDYLAVSAYEAVMLLHHITRSYGPSRQQLMQGILSQVKLGGEAPAFVSPMGGPFLFNPLGRGQRPVQLTTLDVLLQHPLGLQTEIMDTIPGPHITQTKAEHNCIVSARASLQ